MRKSRVSDDLGYSVRARTGCLGDRAARASPGPSGELVVHVVHRLRLVRSDRRGPLFPQRDLHPPRWRPCP